MNLIKNYAFPCYLGAALSIFADINFLQWEFYAILVPTLTFAAWERWPDND